MNKFVKWLIAGVLILLLSTFVLGTLMTNLVPAIKAGDYLLLLDLSVFANPMNYVYGAVAAVVVFLLILVTRPGSFKSTKGALKGGKKDAIDGSALENSRFMTEKERDFNFSPYEYLKLGESKKDGIPVRAIYDKKGLHINLASPMHGLIIGATGSGKTTTFINPMIQILGKSDAGSSMIVTDPKGELFQLHSGFLKERGYKVMVLDLRDPYSSFRWNPLTDIYDRYQQYVKTGSRILRRNGPTGELELVDGADTYNDIWYEYEGKAYSDKKGLIAHIKVQRQKIYDEVYEDLNDLVGVLCPIESSDDPVWEKGARSIIMATILAMLEDSEKPELEMTREKFNFFNVNKAIGNSDNNFEQLKNYFYGRNILSKAVTLSKQVCSAAENTLASYMSIAFDKLSIFNDEGICSLTSAMDINPAIFADEKTALFLKIPDEKDTRHTLAAAFILCIYKALIKKASSREDLSLPRNVYFILDEFGNMPKIDKFDKMITVGRSRKIWFNMVVQSYAQLENVYGKNIADIVKSNCGMKMFIGSNDIETCKEFSELCGNVTVSTTSVSRSMNSHQGDVNFSSQLQTRPLIYPSELQKINNKTDTGNAIIVTFGNYPLKTKFTPSYKCPLYKFGQMSLEETKAHPFFADEVFYNIAERNELILDTDNT